MARRMSYQTTMARALFRDTERDWKLHKTECPKCAAASRARRHAEACSLGTVLLAARRAAADELQREREADHQPIDGEEPLFTLEDCQ